MEQFINFLQKDWMGEIITIIYIACLAACCWSMAREMNTLEERYPMYSRRVRKRDGVYLKFKVRTVAITIVMLIITCLRSA